MAFPWTLARRRFHGVPHPLKHTPGQVLAQGAISPVGGFLRSRLRFFVRLLWGSVALAPPCRLFSHPVSKSGDTRAMTEKLQSGPVDLVAQLAALDPKLRVRLDAAGFRDDRLADLSRALSDKAALFAKNKLSGEVSAPTPEEIGALPLKGTDEATRLTGLGQAAIDRGELAFCVLAGGMATRMEGVVKALAEAFDGKTFLDLRLAENKSAGARAKSPVPLWLMTSEATDRAIREALKARNAPAHVHVFMQDLGLRLAPDGNLFREDDGDPSVYATGHGDFLDALRRTPLLDRFLAQGGKYVWIANLDNLGASIDPLVLGRFIDSKREVMVEVCEKAQGDRGGIPIHAQGKLQVVEEFRLPDGFSGDSVRVFNTNTFLVSAPALGKLAMPSTYFAVEKKVEGRVAIQFERLLQELTAFLDTGYVVVPREGSGSRFLPVKDHDELARRRDQIQEVARARGMV